MRDSHVGPIGAVKSIPSPARGLSALKPITTLAAALCVSAGLPSTALAAPPADWSTIPVTELTMFYPGQSSYEWLLTPAHEEGFEKMPKGVDCFFCHEDDEAKMGDNLVKAGPLEPRPIAGKPGSVKLALQVAYDQNQAYFRAQWKTHNPYPGDAHPYWRFDGKEWKAYGGPMLSKKVQSGEQPGIYEDRFSLLIDDGSVPDFKVHGCWLTCHDGQRDMKDKAGKSEVKGHAILGDQGLKKKDVRKYLPATRNSGHWANTKTRAEIDQIKADGGYLDLMQWRAHRSNPVGMTDDFHVLEYRLNDAGKGPFSKNWDKKKHQPKFMYDPAKFGSNAVQMEQIRSKPTSLIREQNALPFDPKHDWKKGDMIPEYLVSREDAQGSAADNNNAKGTWKDGVWTVVFSRSFGLTNADDKHLKPGHAYTVGFAIHDDNITTRGHYVYWPQSVGFGAEADIEATQVP
jgi:hypothetical protein